MTPRPGGRGSERTLFLLALLLNAFLAFVLVADARMVRGHDTFRYYALQRYFLSEAAHSGELPVWIPQAGDGEPSGPAYLLQAGLFQTAALQAAGLLRDFPFLPLFYVGMFFDSMVFLTGLWLLARRWFASPATVFFVSVAATGSALWVDQVWGNFRVLYALPLTAALHHEWADRGCGRRLFLAINLLALQTLGQNAVSCLGSLLCLLLYGVLARPRLPARRLSKLDGLGLAAGLASALPIIALHVHGPVPAGGIGEAWVRPVDLFGAPSPSLEATAFCGSFTLAFALAALAGSRSPRAVRVLGLAAAVGVLPWLPTPVFLLPVLRMAVIAAAGVGVQRMIDDPAGSRRAALAASALMAGLGILLGGLAGRLESTGLPWAAGNPILRSDLLGAGALGALLAAGVLALSGRSVRAWPMAMGLILFLHPLDVFGWAFRMTWLKTFPLAPLEAEAQRLSPAPWVEVRGGPSGLPGVLTTRRSLEEDSAHFRDSGGPFRQRSPSTSARYYWVPDFGPLLQDHARADEWGIWPGVGAGTKGPKIGSAASIQVLQFSPNRLRLRTVSPPGRADLRLRYADRWAPAWSASINGTPAAVEPMGPSSKAIVLAPGENLVEFRYRDPLLSIAAGLAGLYALAWILTVGCS